VVDNSFTVVTEVKRRVSSGQTTIASPNKFDTTGSLSTLPEDLHLGLPGLAYHVPGSHLLRATHLSGVVHPAL